ncbi:ABC transporter permease [Nocardia huaxiensis]|uniref:ABC transporter permease n=1 Tax=Nocardia huaxiensis TaxID=2755382 RepID=A0A7D6ZQE5_9NOCA|nr:ABC transporter permease [Nocardia huaxiensis]QLY32803.1 ABC transporter permease [Nocardia huaxiensis]UFS93458.1 ABC transporter permease [Nocardia huaxiensis]
MTAITAPRALESPFRTEDFTGTGQMLRLYLRRDRIVLPLWILVLSLPLGSVYIDATADVYPTAADRAGMVASILASPAQLAYYGPVYNDSVGATGIWKAGMFYTLIAVATILTVIRHTRADEESGREELVASTRIGRYAGLTAALLLTYGAALLTGLIAFAGIAGTGVPSAGGLAFGLALAGSGIVFGSVAAVAAQLSAGARTARGIAFAVLGATFTLRAIGDAQAGDGPTNPLTWMAPQGWSLQVRPFAGDHFAVLLLHLLTATMLTALAYWLLRHRDMGAGLIAERAGAAAAGPALSGPFGLAWRLQRGALLAWIAALGLYGLLIGSVTHGIGDQLGSNETVRELITRMGGSASLENSMISYAFTMVGMAAAAYAISAALRLHAEEDSQRTEAVLTGAVGRIRWAASHLVFALGGPALALTISGLLGGLVYGRATGDIGGKLPDVLGAALVQVPAVWVFAGITVLLFGLLPRWTPVAWGVLATAVAVSLLGAISGMPQWFRDLNPFEHAPKIPGAEFTATPLVILLMVDVALIAVGLMAFRRRDLR